MTPRATGSGDDLLTATMHADPFVGEGHAMPKEIEGHVGRKPPEPTANHSDIDDWFRRQMPHLQPTVQALDGSIRATILGLHYAVKWKRPHYGLPELGWIIELAAYDVSVNVVFLGGADFDSTPPLGTTDRRASGKGLQMRLSRVWFVNACYVRAPAGPPPRSHEVRTERGVWLNQSALNHR